MDLIQAAYFVVAILFIVGLKRMAHPTTAKSGIVWAGWGMVLAVLATFFWPGMGNFALILLALLLGSVVAWWAAVRVAMTDMPQMVAIYNGMGGGAAATIAAVELLKGAFENTGLMALAILGGLIGSVAFTGSLIAFAKLQGIMKSRPILFPGQKAVNALVLALTVVIGLSLLWNDATASIVLFFLLALLFGVLMTLPIGGGDMPVAISFYNAFTGMAVGFAGFAVGSPALMVAGTLVGAAGTVKGSLKPIDVEDAAVMLAYAGKVVFVPGYGMALSQAQHKLKELADLLEARGVEVKFAIHPVAGRMPGHMNVLLAEAGVDYDKLKDLEEINPEFPTVDVAVVIGANDVVNPAARRPGSPLYGMPILDVDKAKNVIVIKRGQGKGFAGVENELFYAENTRMLYGDAQKVLTELIQALKRL